MLQRELYSIYTQNATSTTCLHGGQRERKLEARLQDMQILFQVNR